MAVRDSSTDSGRKGAPSKTKATTPGYTFIKCGAKGEWLPAYGGGAGRPASAADPDLGTATDEVYNRRDIP